MAMRSWIRLSLTLSPSAIPHLLVSSASSKIVYGTECKMIVLRVYVYIIIKLTLLSIGEVELWWAAFEWNPSVLGVFRDVSVVRA
jgi:hypothetical protein